MKVPFLKNDVQKAQARHNKRAQRGLWYFGATRGVPFFAIWPRKVEDGSYVFLQRLIKKATCRSVSLARLAELSPVSPDGYLDLADVYEDWKQQKLSRRWTYEEINH